MLYKIRKIVIKTPYPQKQLQNLKKCYGIHAKFDKTVEIFVYIYKSQGISEMSCRLFLIFFRNSNPLRQKITILI